MIKCKLLIISLSFLVVGCDNATTEENRSDNTIPVDTTGVYALNDAFSSNMIKADREYADKYVVILGMVSRISRERGSVYVTLNVQNYDVKCYFSADDENELSTLEIGDLLKIKGLCYGKRNNPEDNASEYHDIVIANCSIIAKMAKEQYINEIDRVRNKHMSTQ